MKKQPLLSVSIALACAGLASQAHASGFALIEFSGSGMGNAFAGGSAIAEDASTVQFNPAGMERLEGRQVSGVLHYISPKAEFHDKGSTDAFGSSLGDVQGDGGRDAYVPNVYMVIPIDEKMKFGLGINTPFGLETDYDDDWIGRYHAVQSDVKTVNINPSISYKVDDKLSIGAGISAQYVDVTLSSAVDFGALCVAAIGQGACDLRNIHPQQDDGFAELTGDTWSFGWNIGLLYNIDDATRLGMAYRSQVTHDVTGDANFTVPGSMRDFFNSLGTFQDTGLSASITLPDSLSLSVVHEYNDTLEVMADVTWTGWSDFKELRVKYDNPSQPDSVTTENWKDSMRYSIGASYRMDAKLKLRGGLAYDQTPVPDPEHRTPRVPGDNRIWVSIGAQYKLDPDMSIDVGYSHLFVNDTQINNTFESDIPTLQANIKGDYNASVNILSAQLNWNF